MRATRVVCSAVFMLAWFAPAGHAQDVDPEALLKWLQAPAVHYEVVAVYSRPTPILPYAPMGRWNETAVTDRFELSFDWNPAIDKLEGRPVFKNFPSTVSKVFEGACRPTVVDGAYEHLEIVDSKQGHGVVELTIKRVFPGGAVPYRADNGACGMAAAASRTETLTHAITVVSGTLFVMPGMGAKAVRVGETNSATGVVIVGKDEKTIIVDDTKTSGWKYTYTLTLK